MRVLHLLSQTGLTGTELFVRDLVEEQRRQGWHVHVLSDRFHVPLDAVTGEMPLSTSSRWERLSITWRLRRLIKREKFDVVHCHSRASARNGYWATFGLKAAMVTTLHGRQKASFTRRVHDMFGTYVSVICDNLRTTMVNNGLTAPDKLKVIRNPVVLARWPFKADRGEPRLLYVGRATGPKGEFFVQLARTHFDAWLRDFPELRIELILPLLNLLSADKRRVLDELCDKYGDRLYIHGSVMNLAPLYQKAWAVIGAGRVAIEAALTGAHVIAAGEHSVVGQLTADRRQAALASNFGDIGAEGSPQVWDLARVDEAVRRIFASSAFAHPEGPAQREWIASRFDSRDIHARYEELYRAARFKRHVPKHVPILMYHKVPDAEIASKHKIYVPVARFAQHLRWFRSWGLRTLTFADLAAYWNGERDFAQFPRFPLVLTFDDGYRDSLTNALPLLEKFGFRATLFLLSNPEIPANVWDTSVDDSEPSSLLMNAQERAALRGRAFEIGAHGVDHTDLTTLDDEAVLAAMRRSREDLTREFGAAPCVYAYTYGRRRDGFSDLARQAGYEFAVNTSYGGLLMSDDRRSLYRVNVFPHDGYFALWKKTRSWYRRRKR